MTVKGKHLNCKSEPPNSIANENKAAMRQHSSRTENSENDDNCGFFRKAIPVMPRPLAILCCILNIVLPGLGTLISSFSVFFCATHNYNTNINAFLVNMLAFLLQLCSAFIIFGWIWSIKYGLLFLHVSGKNKDSNTNIGSELPLFVRRHSSVDASHLMHTKPRISSIVLAKVNEEES